ncbi:hypothetical protein BpHYR1_031550 [Brachionus plicatilis]|uniref:Uncharacterized protein n=1 Tax=Brachionus plicatilis TaxID=10195 RepID=A0A3M7Q9L2_BRAPC|nr:hypothetical protein BpHYR1_031550 [Brachionus plicatilis]
MAEQYNVNFWIEPIFRLFQSIRLDLLCLDLLNCVFCDQQLDLNLLPLNGVVPKTRNAEFRTEF